MSTESCDAYGQPSIQLDLFVNKTKAAIDLQNKNAIQTQQNIQNQQTTSSNATYETGSTAYSIQDCYNACGGYSGTQTRDFCKHSMSTVSCDGYGQPSVQLDLFVNQTKAAIDVQNKNALQTQQNLINQQNYTPPPCPVYPPGSGDHGVPTGCI